MEYSFADIHTHPLINMRYLKKDLTKWVKPPKFYNPLRNQVDADKLAKSGYKICVVNIYAPFRVPPGAPYIEEIRLQIKIFKDWVMKRSDVLTHAKNFSQVESAINAGKIACVLAIEGGHMVEEVKYLEELKKEGIFYITLVHFIQRKIGTTYLSMRRRKIGLKPYGEELLREMKHLGIIPDLAHASDRLMNDVLEKYDGPVIFSHTGARTLCNIERNIPDDVAREIFRRNGLVGIIYCTYYNRKFNFLGSTEILADTAEYFISLGGEDHTCFGSDMDGYILTPSDLKDITQTPNLVDTLRSRFSNEKVEKLTFQNVFRFLKNHFH